MTLAVAEVIPISILSVVCTPFLMTFAKFQTLIRLVSGRPRTGERHLDASLQEHNEYPQDLLLRRRPVPQRIAGHQDIDVSDIPADLPGQALPNGRLRRNWPERLLRHLICLGVRLSMLADIFRLDSLG